MHHYDTIRNLEGIPKKNHKKLIDILGPNEIISCLNKNQGKNIITLENPIVSKYDEIVSGIFNGGVFKNIEVYENKKGEEFDWNILFENGNLVGLREVYDVMFPDTVEGEPRKLRIFNFYAGTAEETEHSSVIHSDPFLAYKSLREQDKIFSVKQELSSVKPLEGGIIFYHHDKSY